MSRGDAKIRELERTALAGDLNARVALWHTAQRAGLPPWQWWSHATEDLATVIAHDEQCLNGYRSMIMTEDWEPYTSAFTWAIGRLSFLSDPSYEKDAVVVRYRDVSHLIGPDRYFQTEVWCWYRTDKAHCIVVFVHPPNTFPNNPLYEATYYNKRISTKGHKTTHVDQHMRAWLQDQNVPVYYVDDVFRALGPGEAP
jgi:hypothetical protein